MKYYSWRRGWYWYKHSKTVSFCCGFSTYNKYIRSGGSKKAKKAVMDILTNKFAFKGTSYRPRRRGLEEEGDRVSIRSLAGPGLVLEKPRPSLLATSGFYEDWDSTADRDWAAQWLNAEQKRFEVRKRHLVGSSWEKDVFVLPDRPRRSLEEEDDDFLEQRGAEAEGGGPRNGRDQPTEGIFSVAFQRRALQARLLASDDTSGPDEELDLERRLLEEAGPEVSHVGTGYPETEISEAEAYFVDFAGDNVDENFVGSGGDPQDRTHRHWRQRTRSIFRDLGRLY